MKLSKKKFIIALTAILITPYTFSQSENYGTWTTISIEKKMSKKWDIDAETELRTIGGNDVYFVRLIERWSLGVGTSYDINKFLKLGTGYDLMNKIDTKYSNYQFRHRFKVDATGRLKINDFTFTLRERVQTTIKDDSQRIRENGTIDTYNMNPEWSWRNRLQINYNIPNFKINPSASVETFYQLNNPDGNRFENIRYTLSLNYKYKKRNEFELSGVYNTELESEDAYGRYVLSFGYKYSF